jgi:hypothetical protein
VILIVNDSSNDAESSRTLPADGHLSPGLRANGDKSIAAFELKFAVQVAQARDLLELAKNHMTLDPYCDPRSGGAYEVHGLYFDTPEFHVYRRIGPHATQKLRLRRYGKTEHVSLEHKKKSNGRVSKQRTIVRDAELRNLNELDPASDWEGFWFIEKMNSRRVRPMCEVSYLRTALTGNLHGDSFRLTLDRQLRCRPFVDWQLQGANEGSSLLNEQLILELKFCDVMPAFFKRLIADFQLSQGRLSKYRMSIEACGLAPVVAKAALENQQRDDQNNDQSLSRSA